MYLILPGIILTPIVTGLVAFRLADRTNGRLVSSGEKRSYLL